MDNELMSITDNEIQVINGSITFNGYERYKQEALKVAEYIQSIEVDEENIKAAKKLLAKVNKSVKSLEDRRILIKKEILEPYNLFEIQIKEIVGIVKDADTLVRSQVKELEEIERENKRSELENIWNDRVTMYDFDFVNFEDFLLPGHLNKTVAVNKTEEEMVTFLERLQNDFTVISGLPDREEVLFEYQNCLDLGTALGNVQASKIKREEVRKVYEDVSEESEEYIFKVFSKKDKDLVELLMYNHDIDYERL